MKKLIVPASFTSLEEIRDYFSQAAQEAGLDEEAIFEVQVAVDEAASNIIDHAYEGECESEIECSYEIMKEINSRTKGFWQPTAGGVYPILRDLEKSGYIKGQWETQKNRRLKVYKITESGEQILRKAILKQTEIFNNIGSLFREFSRDVLNVEAVDDSMPTLPSPFSAFLSAGPLI
jgi:DNA-binding PadR family transcriptional regulator